MIKHKLKKMRIMKWCSCLVILRITHRMPHSQGSRWGENKGKISKFEEKWLKIMFFMDILEKINKFSSFLVILT